MSPDGTVSDVDWEAWCETRRSIFERRPCLNTSLGLDLVGAGRGWARLRLVLKPEVMNPFGAAHGGTTSALIDSAAGHAVAAWCAPDSDRTMGTIDMQVHFLERAQGSELIAEARIIRGGKALAVASVDVRNDAGALVAIGTATYRLGVPGTPRRNED